MAIKDYITKEEVVAAGYKIIDLYDALAKSAARGTYMDIIFQDLGLGYIYQNTLTTVYENTINPSKKLMYLYTASEAGSHCIVFSITGTKNFKLIGFDTGNYNQWGVLSINGIERPRASLAANALFTGVNKPYIQYEVNDLDPDRIYTIRIEYKNGSSIVLDSILLDPTGIIKPINTYRQYTELDENAVRVSIKNTYAFYQYHNIENDTAIKGAGDTTAYAANMPMDKLMTRHPFKLISYKELETVNLHTGALANIGINTAIYPVCAGGSYKFAIRGTKKILLIGRPMGNYTSVVNVFIDCQLYNSFTPDCYYEGNTYWNNVYNAILYEIELPDTGYHDIELKVNNSYCWLDGIACDKAAIVYPYDRFKKYNLYLPKKDGVYYYNGDSYEFKPDKTSYPGYSKIKIPVLSANTKLGMPSRENRFVLGTSTKVFKPRSSGISIKSFREYATLDEIPNWSNAANSSYYSMALAIANTGSVYLKTMKEVPMNTAMDVCDLWNDASAPGGDIYNRCHYHSTSLGSDGQYTNRTIAIKHEGYYTENTGAIPGSLFSTSPQYFNGYAKTNNYGLFRFKTTSSFVSIWNHLKTDGTAPLSKVIGYDIYVNGIRRVFDTNVHDTLNPTSYAYNKFELFKITGLQPDDIIEIRISNAGDENNIYNFGIGIDTNATYTHLVDWVPNIESVDTDIAGVYSDDSYMFKNINTERLNGILSNIRTSYPELGDLDLISSKNIDRVYVLDSSGGIYTSTELEENRVLMCGFGIVELNSFIESHNIDEFELYGIVDIKNIQDVRKFYGTLNDKIYNLEDTSIKEIRDKYLIEDIKKETLIDIVTANTTKLSDNLYEMEFIIPKRPYNINKVVIK